MYIVILRELVDSGRRSWTHECLFAWMYVLLRGQPWLAMYRYYLPVD